MRGVPTHSVTSSGPSSGRSVVSRWLSRLDRYASRPLAAVLVIIVAGLWIAVSVVAGFPARWETVFQTLVAALTLMMVFIIQHTQQRQQREHSENSTRSCRPFQPPTLPLTLEHASDAELHATGHQHRQIRQAALDQNQTSAAVQDS